MDVMYAPGCHVSSVRFDMDKNGYITKSEVQEVCVVSSGGNSEVAVVIDGGSSEDNPCDGGSLES